MSYVVVDVEADGEIPHRNSMVCFGAVVVESSLSKTFFGKTRPISTVWNPDALRVSGFTRREHELFDDPKIVIEAFDNWLSIVSKKRPIFISDNPSFDFSWINYYFHTYLGRNPFGFSGRRIGDLYCGMKMNADLNSEWKRLFRKTKHDHNPVNDALGNAEAILEMQKMGLKIKLE